MEAIILTGAWVAIEPQKVRKRIATVIEKEEKVIGERGASKRVGKGVERHE